MKGGMNMSAVSVSKVDAAERNKKRAWKLLTEELRNEE